MCPAEIAEIAEIKMPIEAIECERIPKEHRRKPQGTPKEHRRIVGHTEITESIEFIKVPLICQSPAERKEMAEI